MRHMLRIAAIFLAALVVAASSASAQGAGKILDADVKASGGSHALAKLLTVSFDGTVTRQSDAKSGTYTLHLESPNRYYSEITSNAQPEIFAYNGKSAWRETSAGELGTLTGPEAVELEAAAQLSNSHFLNRNKSKTAALFAGTEQLNGRNTLHVELTSQSGVKHQLFFDPQSHLLLKESFPLAGQAQEIIYDDYRPESGIPFAHKLRLRHGGESFLVEISQVAFNPVIGERVFDFPKKSQVQLPDLKKLFEEIDANQKAIDKIRENYSGRRSEEETEMDKNGKTAKYETHDYTFFYLNGEEVSTLVAKDGKTLDPSEQEKENQHTRKRIEEIQKQQSKKEAKEERRKEEGKEKKDSDDPGIEIFLRVCQFVNSRRERFRGEDVLVFDFEPNPEYKSRSLVESIVQKLAGVVWVDEKAHQVARIEAYFVGDAKIGGGLLANLQKGTSFVFEQAYINNEVWLPTYMEGHVGARVLLLKGFKVSFVTRYSDYRKFNVETLSTIAKPKSADAASETPIKPQ